MNQKLKEYIKIMLEHDLFWVVYPKDETKESAERLASMIGDAAGVAQLEREDGCKVWGVLISKIKQAEKLSKVAEEESENVNQM